MKKIFATLTDIVWGYGGNMPSSDNFTVIIGRDQPITQYDIDKSTKRWRAVKDEIVEKITQSYNKQYGFHPDSFSIKFKLLE